MGGVTAAVLWEITRHVLVWYFATLSQVNVVYGSLTTSIVVLLSLEIAATLLLLGAQVIWNTSASAPPGPERRLQPSTPRGPRPPPRAATRATHRRARASRPG